jgi:hypothetical protein
MAKTSKSKIYFGPVVDEAILLYNNSEDTTLKNKVFSTIIQPAFDKLAENIIHTFKFYYNDNDSYVDAKHELVVFLYEKMKNYKQQNGKAFSYFSIVAKNFCILRTKVNYKKLKDTQSIEGTAGDSVDDVLGIADVVYDTADEQRLADFIEAFIVYWDTHAPRIFLKEEDLKIVWAVLELFKKRNNIEIFNKKALYVYIREMTDSDTLKITAVVRALKDQYKSMFNDFLKHNRLTKENYI